MTHTEQRNRLRDILSASCCLSPASVYDPLSARISASVGYRVGWLGGRAAAACILAGPNPLLLSLTELADQSRRILRASELSLVVDAGHGFGNALNAIRTVEELEHAGVSALSIEDTTGVLAYGQAEDQEIMVSIEEGIRRIRAALAARFDKALVVAGRTPALTLEGLESALIRAKAYANAGVDAIFLSGDSANDKITASEKLDQFGAIHAATKLPLIIGSRHGSLCTKDQLAACGVRLVLQGHQPTAAAVRALRETYIQLITHGAAADLKLSLASPNIMGQLVNADAYADLLREYMAAQSVLHN